MSKAMRIDQSQRLIHCLCCVCLFVVGPLKAANESIAELRSSKGNYSVKLLKTAFAAPELGSREIIICQGEKVLSKYPSMGSLLNGYWSPDGKYVAINNRRANSGDYLWVFRLSDGQAIWIPDLKHVMEAVKRVEEKFPDLIAGGVNRGYITATGWEDGRLSVQVQIFFLHAKKNLVFLNDVYRIEGGRCFLASETIERPETP